VLLPVSDTARHVEDSAGKRILEEEGVMRLMSSSTSCAVRGVSVTEVVVHADADCTFIAMLLSNGL
jgi:hypothetical protein